MPARTHQPIQIAHERKIHKVLIDLGHLPIEATPLPAPHHATPETVLAIAIDAILKARPIAHDLSQRAATTLIRAGYHDIRTLAASSAEGDLARVVEGDYGQGADEAD